MCCTPVFTFSEAPIDLTGDLNKLRISDLRRAIRENQLDCSDCTEKADFVRLLDHHRMSQPGGSRIVTDL